MIKTIYIILFAAFVFTGCNEPGNNSEGKKSASQKKATGTIADSYTVDTLYSALPERLADISSTEDLQVLLAQDWIMEEDKEALEYADKSDMEIPVRSLSLSPDFTILKNSRNDMEEGTWKFDADKKTLSFKYKGGRNDLYKLRALAADEMKLTNVGNGSETVLKFVAEGKQYKNISDNPFHIANNKWRIKPKSAEDDAAIKQRLKENLQFFILYYKDVIARRSAVVSFYGFPTCLKWYAGGIYLQDKNELSKKWKACFYSDAQALKAFDMMDKVLSKKYTWPKGDANWIKKNLFVLEQMYQQL